MDNVHNPYARPWIGPKVHLKDHFEAFKEAIQYRARVSTGRRTVSDRQVRELVEGPEGLQLDDSLYDEVKANCDIDFLSVQEEMAPQQHFAENPYPKFVPMPIPQSGVKALKTLSLQQEFLEKSTEYERQRRAKGMRNSNNTWFETAPPAPGNINMAVTNKELLVVVRIYRPCKSGCQHLAASNPNQKYTQEIHMLGTNRLSELRDRIKCPADYSIVGPGVDVPPWCSPQKKTCSKTVGKLAKEVYKSGFFYVEGQFYNDTRWPDCFDYSLVIREWAAAAKRQLGPFGTGVMQDTQVQDLEVRLGYPYVYVHQGDHEHVFSFVDVRLVSIDDQQRPTLYPLERSVGSQHSKMCMLCSVNVAKWVTTQNERVPEDPFFYCEECFKMFNYDKNNQKIGHFQARPFVDSNAI